MAEEIVTLKVTTQGDQAALQSLTKIDRLISKLNGKKIKIAVTGGNEAVKAAQASKKAIQENIAAQKAAAREQSRLVEQNMSQMGAVTREQLRSELIWQVGS